MNDQQIEELADAIEAGTSTEDTHHAKALANLVAAHDLDDRQLHFEATNCLLLAQVQATLAVHDRLDDLLAVLVDLHADTIEPRP